MVVAGRRTSNESRCWTRSGQGRLERFYLIRAPPGYGKLAPARGFFLKRVASARPGPTRAESSPCSFKTPLLFTCLHLPPRDAMYTPWKEMQAMFTLHNALRLCRKWPQTSCQARRFPQPPKTALLREQDAEQPPSRQASNITMSRSNFEGARL